MATIYLSSTYEDLKDFRSAVVQALRQSEYHVIAMEDYVATERRPVDKCLKDVEKANIYIGVFAFRYGYIPPIEHNNPNSLSITELELRHAQRLKKPCLTFLADQKSSGFSATMMDAFTGDGETGKHIKRLREELGRELTANFFSAPYHLASLVQSAVASHLATQSTPSSSGSLESSASAAIIWNIEKDKDGSPYPGLMHFTRKYAPVFFGRDLEVAEILDRLRKPEGRFLLISGASGSGKSSLVDAGVLPRIEKDGIIGDKTYTSVRMVPSGGIHLFDALLRPLHAYAERAEMDAYQVAEELVREPALLSQRIHDIVAKGLNTDGLVLFLDQMEELFTLRDQAQSQAFLSALYQAAQEARLHVIATIRSDFLQHCHEHVDLLKALKGLGHYPLGPIDSISIGEMIAKPARCAGLTIAEVLVRRLVKEAGQERGSLPLLAFALRQLFDKRSGNELTEMAFDQLGGLAGAIRSHVEAIEEKIAQSLAPKDRGVVDSDVLQLVKVYLEKEAFPKLFAALVVVSIDRTPTRQWASKEKFDAKLRSVIDVLIQERLLTADEGRDHESLVSVAHERLFEGWPRLAAWIDANREDLFTLHQAKIEAGEWKRHGYNLNYLWPEERLKRLAAIIQGLGHEHEHVTEAVRLYAAPQDKLIERLQGDACSHHDRLKIGQYLAAFGDPRPGGGLTKDGLPNIVWIEVPGGRVSLEKNRHVFKVKPFRIAKYPVTHAQFKAFLDAEDGFQNKKWWKDIEQSSQADQPSWQEANSPRETVSWCEAIAFCRWLSAKTGKSIRLPTEWEWQQAATGGDPEREYPWEGGWDAARCNSYEGRVNRTTAVGMYPQGATQQGVLDMAGNVWEWCLNKYQNPEEPEAVRIDKKDEERVIRGGSWNSRPGGLRASNRFRDGAGTRYFTIGFRLAQDLGP